MITISDTVLKDNTSNRWRTPIEDYVFPYDLHNLMIKPKLHEVPAINIGTDHAVKLTSYAGYEARTRYCQENRFSVTYLWEAVDAYVREKIRHFHCDYVYGKVQEFWMPLWIEEFSLGNGIQSGSYTVGMYPNGLSHVFPDWMYPELGWNAQALFIRKKNGDQYVRPIASCISDSYMVLKEPFPIDIAYNEIFMASRVRRWTFASGLTENWIGNIGNDLTGHALEISATFQVVSGVSDGKGCVIGIDFDEHRVIYD